MRRDYTEEEIRRGLTELALSAGNHRAAAKRLKEQGSPIPASTLRNWGDKLYRERYAEVAREIVPSINARIAEDCERNAIRQGELAAELTERMADDFDRLKPAEAAGALRNIEVSKAINVDKAALLRNRPTAIIERRSADDLLRGLAALGPNGGQHG